MRKFFMTYIFFIVFAVLFSLVGNSVHAQTVSPTDTTLVTTAAPTDTVLATGTPSVLPNTAGANPTLVTVALGSILVLIGSYSLFVLKKK